MPYLIDGHNLIGRVPGLNLDDLDDEKALIEMLMAFCLQNGKDAEVVFDHSATGHARARVHGRVTARFVRSGETADQAIARRLKNLGNAAANGTVVSSDRQVQNFARRARARVVDSSDFSRELLAGERPEGMREYPQISEDEIDNWLDMFGENDD